MSHTGSWIMLVIAGLLEVCWAIGLKYSDGFTKPIPSAITVLALFPSMFLLARASQTLPIGTAYGVWVGIGTLGATILGIYLFKESSSLPRLFFLMLLLVAIVGLKVTAK
jgi:quaternary ammonium compound-resistance protein SugE